ncbi:hypothetical protein GO986_00220 [Deinococcus sp. HMF7620]|uniref:Uncharacterized protein n=1 Tax=Deinococcus arboris TaxID=2682977 RepID=A0A7C9HP58_9DEIO|nr:hypothetical protein [Deinococcus arboris]MVN85194.1 hypothetical protein [Deinococcus arboris]
MGEGRPGSSTDPNAGVSQGEQLSNTTDPRPEAQGGTDVTPEAFDDATAGLNSDGTTPDKARPDDQM